MRAFRRVLQHKAIRDTHQYCLTVQSSSKLKKLCPFRDVLPSGRNHHRSPFLRPSFNFFPKRVAIKRVRGMAKFSLLTRAREHDVLAARIDVNIILTDVHTSLHALGRSHHRSPFLHPSFNFLPKRVAIRCVRAMAKFSLLTRAPEHGVLAARIDVNIILTDVHTSLHALGRNHHRSPFLRPSFRTEVTPMCGSEVNKSQCVQAPRAGPVVISSWMRRIRLSEGKKAASAHVSGCTCFYRVCLTAH